MVPASMPHCGGGRTANSAASASVRVLAVKSTAVAGFVRDQRFYSREEVALSIARAPDRETLGHHGLLVRIVGYEPMPA